MYASEFYDYEGDPLERKNLITESNYKNEIEKHKEFMEDYFREQNRLVTSN